MIVLTSGTTVVVVEASWGSHTAQSDRGVRAEGCTWRVSDCRDPASLVVILLRR